jgi:gamma-glutamyl-gamma-aminobutyrate hydrolase PuuD
MVEGLRFFQVGKDDRVTEFIRAAKGIVTTNFANADMFVFTGGADITPFLYGQKKLAWTHNDFHRDLDEIAIFKSIPTDKPKIGICRGAQFLNVMSGGSMWQHVNGHEKPHMMKWKWHHQAKEEHISVSSDHHQMMLPGDQAEILGAAMMSTEKHHEWLSKKITLADKQKKPYDDPEVVYYWNTSSLCWQPHPEYNDNNLHRDLFWDAVSHFLLKKKETT